MKKIARFLMLGAVGIGGLSVIWMLITILFQRSILEWRYGLSMETYAGQIPAIPVDVLVYGFGVLAVLVVLLFAVCDGRKSLWIDVGCAGALSVVFPVLLWGIDRIQRKIMENPMDVQPTVYYGLLNSVCKADLEFMEVAICLALVACGMSIAVKYANGACKKSVDVV